MDFKGEIPLYEKQDGYGDEGNCGSYNDCGAGLVIFETETDKTRQERGENGDSYQIIQTQPFPELSQENQVALH